MCGQCDGQCRQGLPVQDVLRFATYADGYGQFALGRERFQELDVASMPACAAASVPAAPCSVRTACRWPTA